MIAECLRNISHPYKNVRELIGRLVYKAVANDWKPKDQPQPYVINFFDQLLILLQSQKEKYDTLTPEQILADTPDFVKTSKTRQFFLYSIIFYYIIINFFYLFVFVFCFCFCFLFLFVLIV